MKNIASEIDALPPESEAYLNRNTGELYVMFDEFDLDLDDPDIADMVPEWQKEDVAKRREVLNDPAWLALPNAFDIHEWELMKEFSDKILDREVREDLLKAIRGSGAFQRFKRALDRHHRRDEWFAFKEACIEEVVKEWLRSQNIEFEEQA